MQSIHMRWVGRSHPTKERAHSTTALDVPDKPKALSLQAEGGLLRTLETIDQEASGIFHRSEFGYFDYLMFVPAFTFSAYFIPVIFCLTFFLVPARTWVLSLVGCIATLLVTLSLKRQLGRIRPGAHTLGRKRLDLRSLEKNNAMPSGDSAQSALFLTMYALALGRPELVALIPLTMLGRVYFGCHWFGDTIVGASLGMSVAWAVFRSGNFMCDHDPLGLLATLCGDTPPFMSKY